MTKPIKTHQDCPHCGHKGCFSIFEGGGYYCHSCSAKSPALKEEDLHELKPVKYRALNKNSVDKYGVLTGINHKDEEIKRVYPYPHMPKFRYLPKDFSKNYGFQPHYLFGMDKFNSGSYSSVTIVEGEDDAPAAWQMLGGYEAVVALPSATIHKKLLDNCYKWLDGFSQIIICVDNDSAGDQAASRIAAVFPNKSYRVNLTKYKDPMEYLENGEGVDFKIAWNNRVKYVPEFDTSTPDGYLKLFREDEDNNYIPTGIEAYDEKHLGLFQGHVTIFQAPEGTGKTELFHYFEHHMIKNYPDIPFASCHLEESKKRTLLGWVSYDLEKNVTRKDLITDTEEVEKSIKRLTEHENAHLFTIGTDEDPDVLIDRVKYYINVFGCKYIFFEPIQDLAQQYSGPENTERFLSRMAVMLARVASEYSVGIVLIAHENDDGLISDCRKLSKQASVVVRMEREIDSPDEDIRNTTTLRSKKNRPTAFVGYGGQMKFDASSFTMREAF